jgi:hypothetical protein
MLPKIDSPTYRMELPLSKTKIEFRPFVVKEQRNLLMAVESKDSEAIQKSVRDILNNCTITSNVDIETLPIVDVEYYFMNLRARSVGEIVETRYKCNNIVEGKKCNNIMEKDINLLEIQVENKDATDPVIQLTDTISVKLKYPDFSFVKESLQFDDINDLTFNMIAKSIEWIYDGEQYYYTKEVPQQETVEFVEQLSQAQFEKIEAFFSALPKLRTMIEMDCRKCNFHHEIEVEGLESFFT